MALEYLIAEPTETFAKKFNQLYMGSEPIAVADSDRYRPLLIRLHREIHPDTKLILFTSGSEGRPKMVELSRKNLEANLYAVVKSLHFGEVKEQTLFLPLYYSFGLLGQLLPAMQLQIPTLFLPNMLALKGRKLRGMLSAVGTQWDVLVKLLASEGPQPEVTHVVSAGARLSVTTRQALRKLFPKATLFNNYGQTECSPRILSMSSDDAKFFTDAAGYPVHGIEAKLSPEGELWVKGPQVMLAYLGDAEGTAEKLVGGFWLNTGDLASIADDGCVTIHGRKDDLVKIGGERVSLQQYSQVVLDLNLAREAIAVSYTDTAGLERVALVLGTGEEAGVKSESLVLSRVKAELMLRSPLTVVPTKVVFLTELPKLPNGKLSRAGAKQLVEHTLGLKHE